MVVKSTGRHRLGHNNVSWSVRAAFWLAIVGSILTSQIRPAFQQWMMPEQLDSTSPTVWYRIGTSTNNSITAPEITPPVLQYRGVSGIGHRLARQGAAYHLAKALGLSKMNISWATCFSTQKDEPHEDIWKYLFGSQILDIPPASKPIFPWIHVTRNESKTVTSQNIRIKNDVPNYYRLMLPFYYPYLVDNDYFQKFRTDLEMYDQMLRRFRFRDEVDNFTKTHNFSDYNVIGLHVRAGNGEKGEFLIKGRQIADPTTWIERVAGLLSNYTGSAFFPKNGKPPLVFIATDTESYINDLQHSLKKYAIPVVSFPQPRVNPGTGISIFSTHQSTAKCLADWKYQTIDMVILAFSDVLLTGLYSSYTQTIPITWQFRNDLESSSQLPRVCQFGRQALNLQCYVNWTSWVVQRPTLTALGDKDARGQKFQNQFIAPMQHITKAGVFDSLVDGTSLQVEYLET